MTHDDKECPYKGKIEYCATHHISETMVEELMNNAIDEKVLTQFAWDIYYQAITLLNPKTMSKLTENEIVEGSTPLIDMDKDIVEKLVKVILNRK